MTYQCISIDQATEIIDQGGATILDIRDPESFSQGNVENSIHVTNDNVETIINTADKSKPLIIYCYHGNSSKNAAEYFYNMGFKMSYSVDGGFEEWKLRLGNQ
ncbi:thiosulfate sulfurtransferase GlpE [Pseudomaricurvus alkylphenolicus]|uniref:thiosulfate sulfurtransferase GlpE n=1 Tax=Pseudomaricurvus alkylphenolicus TaxID=1306991 RepID=UPI00142221CB|nr:thiosulfate sulfurtransferase GlpE [Pseudomaricurvus alkylphenolicus]NIB43482.1 thiosulfate sulfurtransferase GlpE [Pseudomaricurvus alkylphenolicus]